MSAIVGGVVAVTGAIVGVLALYPPDWLRMGLDPAQATAEHVRSCMDRHDLRITPSKNHEEFSEAHHRETGEYSRSLYAACTWPASSSTQVDGYSEVIVLTVDGFGDSEASSATIFDRIMPSCSTVELIYNRAGMGEHGAQPPVRLSKGQVAYAAEGKVDPFDGPWQVVTSRGITVGYPDPEEIVVLHNGRRILSQAACV